MIMLTAMAANKRLDTLESALIPPCTKNPKIQPLAMNETHTTRMFSANPSKTTYEENSVWSNSNVANELAGHHMPDRKSHKDYSSGDSKRACGNTLCA